MRDIEAQIRRKIENAEKVIVNTLKYVGEMCVNEARSNGDYIDQTGNLRSSIGYVILKDGVIASENVKASSRGSDKSTGTREAKQFINELAAKFDKGIVLIVVAGMNYASLVETRRNVLSSARLLAKRETPRMMQELGFIKRAA
ncbi:MAG: hypothetical protein ACK5M3_05610 [Dysgonomonas sp.]